MNHEGTRWHEQLGALVGALRPEDRLPAFLALQAAQARILAEIASGRPQADPGGMTQAGAVANRLITPERAAEIATVPVRRIYEWARGQRWASRPSRRCLRIDEDGFRGWLKARR